MLFNELIYHLIKLELVSLCCVLLSLRLTFQVRIQRRVETPSLPPAPETSAENEPEEQDELLEDGAAAEQSQWL